MPFIDDLRSARQSPVAAIHEFKLNYDRDRTRWHCFFEGHTDQGFYWPVLTRYVSVGYLRAYRCGNKRAVLNALEHVSRQYPDCTNALFFVDKDLSDVLVGESNPRSSNLFVTDTYSIENYLVTEAVLIRVLQEIFRISGVSFDFAVLTAGFRRSIAQFYRVTTPLMAWVVAAKRAGARPNLNNIQLGKLIVLDDALSVGLRLDLRLAAAYLEATTGVSKPVHTADWRRAYKELKGRSGPEIVRGKFAAWFFLQFVARIEDAMKVAANEVGGTISASTLLHARNFVEILGSRAEVPGVLAEFLERHLGGSTAPIRIGGS